MTAPLDYQSPSNRRQSSRFPTALVVLLALLGLGVLLFRPLMILLMAIAFHGTSKSVPPADASRSVAVSLMHWGVFGAVPRGDPDYTNRVNSIAGRMTGINGYTESDGFHGDGTDWYELELAPDLADELRSSLAESTTVKKGKDFSRESSAPSWWPQAWPADAQCYEKDLEYLVLPDTGTRAWFMRVRT
jgi:hypothetical protein